jgi:hypothetical protein
MISEETCAVKLGLKRDVMTSMRGEHLVEGDDWTVQNRRVMITESGMEKLLEAVGISRPEQNPVLPESQNEQQPDQPQPSPAEALPQNRQEVLSPPKPTEVTLIIAKPPPRNRYIIEAVPKDGGEMVRVRVHDNQNFLPGMEIEARPDEAYSDVFVLIGRCPRYRGRW